MTNWRPIETAPKDVRIKLLIPYDRELFSEGECTDFGQWETDSTAHRNGGYFRFDGDDGPDDIQPTHWAPCELVVKRKRILAFFGWLTYSLREVQ